MPAGTGFRVFASPASTDRHALAALAELDLVNVADAMHGVGCVDSAIRPFLAPVPRVVGPALTVLVTPGNGLMIRRAILLARSGDVLVVNAFANTERAVLGGSIVADMIAHGIAGLVIDGAVRDIAEIRELGLPVFARALSSRSGTDLSGKGEVNVPIACGGVVVFPGDIILADQEGIVVVPRRDASLVAAHAAEVQKKKGSIAELATRKAQTGVGKVRGYAAIAETLRTGGCLEFDRTWTDEE